MVKLWSKIMMQIGCPALKAHSSIMCGPPHKKVCTSSSKASTVLVIVVVVILLVGMMMMMMMMKLPILPMKLPILTCAKNQKASLVCRT